MRLDRWPQIEQLFHAVQERPAEREVLLAQADPEIRREVESLLAEPGAEVLNTQVLDRRLTAGTQLGPYRILGLLGVGGMGEVYRAQDTRLGREVALKLLPQDRLRDPERRRRFLQEARAASALNHPNIMTFYDLLEADGQVCLVLEHVTGQSLDQAIPKKGLPLNQVLSCAVQIADALAAAHAAGVVHRDLKPANVMVTEKGTVKLLDFGLAKLIAPEPPAKPEWAGSTKAPHTQAGMILGTLAYMSPEQAEGKLVDARSDIFSFGCILYEMLTGQRAFQAGSAAGLISAILTVQPRPLAEIHPQTPAALVHLLDLCLAKDPDHRWQSARDIQHEFTWIRATTGVQTPSAKRDGRWRLVAVLSLATLAGAIWYGAQSRPLWPPWRIRPLTAYAGLEECPVLSPDGERVAFIWNGPREDNRDIYVKQVADDGLPLRITSDPAPDVAPCWSPDGRRIAYLRASSEATELMVASSLGGGERRIARLRRTVIGESSILPQMSWSPDGKYLVVSQGGLVRVEVQTGETLPLSTPPGGQTDVDPAYSPDGRSVAFLRGSTALNRELYIQQLARAGQPQGPAARASEGLFTNIGLTWIEGGHSLLAGAGFPGSFVSLFRVQIGSPTVGTVALDSLAVWYPSYSLAAHRLAYQRRWLDLNISRIPLRDDSTAPVRVVASTHLDMALNLSPDGSKLVFCSSRNGDLAIWRANRDGSGQILLASMPNVQLGSPSWSPDGQQVVFDAGTSAVSTIWTVSADGGKPRQVTQGPTSRFRPAYSRDGRQIFYSSSQSGHVEIWSIPVEGGEARQITKGGGDHPIPSYDQKWLFYHRDASIWRTPLAGGDEKRVVENVRLGCWITAADGRLYVLRPEDHGESTLSWHDPDAGTTGRVRRFNSKVNPYYAFQSLAVNTHTGEIFFQHIDRDESDLMLVENFPQP